MKQQMKSVKVDAKNFELVRLIEETNAGHSPLLLKSGETGSVIVPLEEWESIQETLYLLSVPGMREKIRAGLNVPVEECFKELPW
jgi:PHD/YefM family antitoxin component YafN of YafNO toxin-antitoxin module